MALIAICMPILPGKKKQWEEMMEKLNTEPTKSVFSASRADAGVHERTFLQETPGGDFVLITLEGDNPAEAFGKMMADPRLADVDFAKFAGEVHGMDMSGPPPPPPKLVYDSKA